MSHQPLTPRKHRWVRLTAITLFLIAAWLAWDHNNHPVFWGPQYLVRLPVPHDDGLSWAQTRRHLQEIGLSAETITVTNDRVGRIRLGRSSGEVVDGPIQTSKYVHTDCVLSDTNQNRITIPDVGTNFVVAKSEHLLFAAGIIGSSQSYFSLGDSIRFWVFDLERWCTNRASGVSVVGQIDALTLDVRPHGLVCARYSGYGHEELVAWEIADMKTPAPPAGPVRDWDGAKDVRWYGRRLNFDGRSLFSIAGELSAFIYVGLSTIANYPYYFVTKDYVQALPVLVFGLLVVLTIAHLVVAGKSRRVRSFTRRHIWPFTVWWCLTLLLSSMLVIGCLKAREIWMARSATAATLHSHEAGSR